jgi:hypothetical protein
MTRRLLDAVCGEKPTYEREPPRSAEGAIEWAASYDLVSNPEGLAPAPSAPSPSR